MFKHLRKEKKLFQLLKLKQFVFLSLAKLTRAVALLALMFKFTFTELSLK